MSSSVTSESSSSTGQARERAEASDLGTVSRVGVIAAFTAVETVALAVWLAFVQGAPVVSAAVAIGLGVLVVGLFVEHVLTDVAVNGLDLDVAVGPVVAVTVTETVLWAVWLEIAVVVGGLAGLGLAFVVLAVLLVPQHTVEDNGLRGADLLGDLVDLDTVGFSLVEAAGATVWLALVLQPDLVGGTVGGVDAAAVGLGVLAVALFVEHNIGVRFSRR